jgi:hypothetical protein
MEHKEGRRIWEWRWMEGGVVESKICNEVSTEVHIYILWKNFTIEYAIVHISTPKESVEVRALNKGVGQSAGVKQQLSTREQGPEHCQRAANRHTWTCLLSSHHDLPHLYHSLNMWDNSSGFNADSSLQQIQMTPPTRATCSDIKRNKHVALKSSLRCFRDDTQATGL